MTTPLISIIIPVYNTEKYLQECIDSVLAQTYENFELLLINDGSKDGSPQICDAYAAKDDRVKVFHQENAGVSAARNKGLDNATGEYVSFVDADDTVIPEYLEKMMGAMSTERIDLVSFGYCKIYEDNKKVFPCSPTKSNGTAENLLTNLIVENETLTPWMCLVRRNIVFNHKISFIEGCRYGEDQEFVYKLLVHCSKVTAVESSLYNYRIWNGSAMAKKTLNILDNIEASIRSKEYLETNLGIDNKVAHYFRNIRLTNDIMFVIYSLCKSGYSANEIHNIIRCNPAYQHVLSAKIIRLKSLIKHNIRLVILKMSLKLYISACFVKKCIVNA